MIITKPRTYPTGFQKLHESFLSRAHGKFKDVRQIFVKNSNKCGLKVYHSRSLSFMWRLWRHKLSTDDLWRRQGYIIVSRCWCCKHPTDETFELIFLTSHTVSKVWQHFLGYAGNSIQLIQVKQVIRAWWNIDCCPKLKPLFQEAPSINTWELWKKGNTCRNRVTVSTNRVIHEVNKTLHNLARIKFPWLSHIPVLWPEMIQFFEAYKPILITRKFTWQLPRERWYKCNTGGASKGNPGPSSLGFCVRDDAGDLIYARSVNLDETTNVVAEAKAILQGLEYCYANSLHPLILETDCLLLKKIIEREWEPHWCVMAEVQKIQELRDHFNVIFQHVYREGNTLADYIANIAFSFARTTHFYSFT
ncbi:uncharacterized protein [Nicotiana tomentosiformis]|uniref:uncharacterized protein n=1 Tax=Nicotiana tomentosiformis TaxID=4098 RepID=UPI00388C53B6